MGYSLAGPNPGPSDEPTEPTDNAELARIEAEMREAHDAQLVAEWEVERRRRERESAADAETKSERMMCCPRCGTRADLRHCAKCKWLVCQKVACNTTWDSVSEKKMTTKESK